MNYFSRISKRERTILLAAAAVTAVFLLTRIVPSLTALYQQRNEDLETQRLDIERERRLIDETASWRDRRVEVENLQTNLVAQTFTGATASTIEASLQSALTGYARDSEITVLSTRLAERMETKGWLLIRQEMSFRTTNAGNTIRFLQRLDESSPRLWVTKFNLGRSRNQYDGTITVVGFANSEGLPVSGPSAR